MIIVKNRELLVPLPERYLGTSYDTSSEIRQFRISRFAQNGTDLSPLTFYVDLLHADGSNAYDTITMGEVGDTNYKVVDDNYIILTWYITRNVLQNPGVLFVQLRAMDSENTVRWGSYKTAFYVERHLNAPGNYGGSLTLIEQIQQDHNYFKSVIDEVAALPQYVDTAEAWAVGRRNGHAVASDDVTYQNNSKWYATRAEHMAGNAYNYMGITEAMSFGTVDGEPVGSDDPNYHNNAKYYAEQANYHSNAAMTSSGHANDYKLAAEGWAVGQNGGADVASTDPSYHNNAKYYAEQAGTSATAAAQSAGQAANSAENAAASEDNAEASASAAQASDASAATAASNSQNYSWDAEAWAVGQRNGSNVGSSDIAYHNNAKYYAEQADASSNLASVHKDAAQTAATNAAASATGAAGSANDAEYYADQAAASAASLTVDSALSDSSTNPVQNKVITAEITDVKTAINESNNGHETLDVYEDFEKGNISSGNNAASNYRVRSVNIMTFDRDLILKADNLYRFLIVTYEGTTYKSTSSWLTSTQILSGTAFRIVIGKTDSGGTEDKTNITNIYAFVRAIKVDTVMSDRINSLSVAMVDTHGVCTLGGTYTQGDLSNGSPTNPGRKYRAFTTEIKSFDFDTVVFADEGYRIFRVGYNQGVYTNGFGWRTRIFIPKGSQFRMVLEIIDTTQTIDVTDAANHVHYYSADRMQSVVSYPFDSILPAVWSINHRGYHVDAPENTLPAYKLSAQQGFPIVESDVQWTSDGVPVLLHDNTINRTALNDDGTVISTSIAIADITYAQALEYDFSREASAEYRGTKIPTFVQWIELCKALKLVPQIEVKANPTDAQIADLISTVRAYGMEKSVMWLGGQEHMQKIVDLCPVACVVRYYNGPLTEDYVLEYAALHTGYNRVGFEVAWDNYNSNKNTMFDRLLKYDIVSGIYGINLSDDILSLDKRMQIISTDRLVAADVIREANE